MYEYIKGKISELAPMYAVLDNGNIGYYINISLNTYSQITEKEDCMLFIHQIIREDANTLYGFADKNEREIFRLLISVSGIGANTARMMLSSLSPSEIQKAIQNDNVSLIKSIKGIGIKTAQRVIIDLKDKISKTETETEIFTPKYNTIKEESLSALVMLGFSKIAVEKTIDKILAENKTIRVEDLVKKALKQL
jgi:Holliday junction DNA helicase RuvA